MEERSWGIGAKLWFGFVIASQWLMYINEITKGIPNENAKLVYLVSGIVGTVLYLWLAISKKWAAMITIIVVAVISLLNSLMQGGGGAALLTLIVPGITWLISRGKLD